MANTHIYR